MSYMKKFCAEKYWYYRGLRGCIWQLSRARNWYHQLFKL